MHYYTFATKDFNFICFVLLLIGFCLAFAPGLTLFIIKDKMKSTGYFDIDVKSTLLERIFTSAIGILMILIGFQSL